MQPEKRFLFSIVKFAPITLLAACGGARNQTTVDAHITSRIGLENGVAHIGQA